MRSPRPAGVAVLALAVMVLALGAGAAGRTVAGTAGAAPVGPTPAAGDCLLATTESAAQWIDDNGLRAPERSFGACEQGDDRTASEVVGEVAVILTERSGRPHDDCAEPVGRYVGFDGLPSRSSGDLWHPAGGTTVVVVNPDNRQWADGQRWQACVLLPPLFTADGVIDPVRATATNLRSARGAWADPGYRNRLGDCLTVFAGPIAELTASVFCGTAHDQERLAVASWERDAPQAAYLRQTCGELAAGQLGATDRTRAGVLTTEVVVTDPDGHRAPVAEDDTLAPEGQADCVIRPVDAGQQLTATLLGRRDAPLPLAPR
ncbi:hypothetical protein FDO65_16390 [Nakamurella flava]|uniref:Septum formation-related domain-containing protein n=1 Tax=Nakamurella flava TaxID=2576308 RepID=A0A4V6CT06_9ACTN|nr:septum formation family protein [Nakamurella flava]TKV57725.1 hypothetical protein FDO65_16390 [Nakamurella flava]